MRGAKARRLLLLGGALLLVLAPRGVSEARLARGTLQETAPRPGLIRVSWDETQADPLELEPPDLLAPALRVQATELEIPPVRAVDRAKAPSTALELPAVGLPPPGLRPVAEPPRGLLLFLAGPFVSRFFVSGRSAARASRETHRCPRLRRDRAGCRP